MMMHGLANPKFNKTGVEQQLYYNMGGQMNTFYIQLKEAYLLLSLR